MQTFHSKNYKVLGYYQQGIPGIGKVWIIQDISKNKKSKSSDSNIKRVKSWSPRYILSKEFKLVDSGQIYFYKSDGSIENNQHHLVNYSILYDTMT